MKEKKGRLLTMEKWIENFKKIYNEANIEEQENLRLALQDKLDEKGYSFEKSEKILNYINA